MPASDRSPTAAPGAPPGAALAAAADRECRRIARALADARHRHHGIHRARKSIRLLRAQLGLLKPALAAAEREHLRRIDGRLKRLCRGLAPLRDAHVAALTAGTLRRPASPAGRETLEAALVERRDAALAGALALDPGLRRRREAIGAIRGELAALPWNELDARAARRAIRRSRRRSERAEQEAGRSPTSPLRHRWRRRLRRLRLQLEALAAVAPALAPDASKALPGSHALKRQTDRLGRLQDVQLMCRLALRIEPLRTDPAVREVLAAALREARAGFAAGG
ncbi:MAG TPA: CHAD domain-containing protein [Dyella sp.]|nr:CHAD domain-containing protein [Dyella sp.]